MNTGFVASFLGVTALWMALVALGTGALASFLIAPIALRARGARPGSPPGGDADDPALGGGNGPPHRPGRSRTGGRRLSGRRSRHRGAGGGGGLHGQPAGAPARSSTERRDAALDTLGGTECGDRPRRDGQAARAAGRGASAASSPGRGGAGSPGGGRAAPGAGLGSRAPSRAPHPAGPREAEPHPGRESRERGSWSISASRASTSPTIPRSATTTWRSIAIASPTPTCGDTRPDRARP